MRSRPSWRIASVASVALAASLAVLAASSVGRLEVASEILRRAERVRSPRLDYAVDFRLDVVSPNASWKHRTALYSMIAHGKDHSLVVMREPDQFYPGTLLIAEGLYWMLLPRSDRPFQMAPRHVLNGDVSHGDLARGNLLAFYEPRLDGEEEVAGRTCYRLELTRKRNLGLYARILCWIDVENFRPLRFQYYGHTGAVLKTADYEDYRDGPLGVRAARIRVTSHTRPGETTTLTFSDLRPIDAASLSFTVEGMVQLRDAARELQKRSGRQALVEEMIEALELGTP